jgi:hypothetical protein
MRIRWILAALAAVVVIVVGVLVGTLLLGGALSPAESTGEEMPRDEEVASGAPTEDDEDFGTVEIYTVLEDGTLDPAATGLTAQVWKTFQRVVTVDFTAEVITQFRVGDAPESDTLAYVYQDEDPEYWILAANLATSEDESQLIATLVHEYAHILTLGAEQMAVDAASCTTLDLDEGCAAEDAMLTTFFDTFWSGYGDSAPELDNADGDVGYAFYEKHEDDFLSDYAATNAVEDIAESFMTFVLEDEPSGDGVVAQKLAFFWGYPELEAIRERIRVEFAEELGLAV